jgi:hypothetical protein
MERAFVSGTSILQVRSLLRTLMELVFKEVTYCPMCHKYRMQRKGTVLCASCSEELSVGWQAEYFDTIEEAKEDLDGV